MKVLVGGIHAFVVEPVPGAGDERLEGLAHGVGRRGRDAPNESSGRAM